MNDFIQDYLKDLQRLVNAVPAEPLEQVIGMLGEARENGRNVFAIGNGGSASTASHFVNDMGKGASVGRDKRFRVIPLTDNVEWMTALGNDLCYEDIFVEQLKNFAESGDVLIAFSGSGNSENVLRAVRYANEIGCNTVGFCGRGGGALADLAGVSAIVESDHMGRIEDMHMVMQHVLCYYFMEAEPNEVEPN